MLGGSFWIAMLRHMMGAALMMGVFFLLDRPRFSIKRTAVYYCVFGVLAAAVFGVWYLVGHADDCGRRGILAWRPCIIRKPRGAYCGHACDDRHYSVDDVSHVSLPRKRILLPDGKGAYGTQRAAAGAPIASDAGVRCKCCTCAADLWQCDSQQYIVHLHSVCRWGKNRD